MTDEQIEATEMSDLVESALDATDLLCDAIDEYFAQIDADNADRAQFALDVERERLDTFLDRAYEDQLDRLDF